MDPISLATMASYAAAAGAAVTVVSTIQQGKVSAANAESSANIAVYNGQVAKNTADYNAQVATNNAATARMQATRNEEAQRRESAIQMGKLRASIIDSGQGLAGTGGGLYGQSLATAELDAKNIMYEGTLRGDSLDMEAAGIKRNSDTAAVGYGLSADQYRSNAKTAISGSYLSAAGAAFSGAGTYMNQQALLKKGATT